MHEVYIRRSIDDINLKSKQLIKMRIEKLHTRGLGTSSNSIRGSSPCCLTKTIFCSQRWLKKGISFWHALTITSSGSSGLNNETNLLYSTAYKNKILIIARTKKDNSRTERKHKIRQTKKFTVVRINCFALEEPFCTDISFIQYI